MSANKENTSDDGLKISSEVLRLLQQHAQQGNTNVVDSLLLQNVLETQRLLADKLDKAIERMATKEDIATLALRETVNAEIRALEGRVKASEDYISAQKENKLPKWFWPAIVSIMGFFGPALGVAANYLLNHHP